MYVSHLTQPYVCISYLIEVVVAPSLEVAPAQDGEEDGADDCRHQHHKQAQEGLVTNSVQGVIIKPKTSNWQIF